MGGKKEIKKNYIAVTETGWSILHPLQFLAGSQQQKPRLLIQMSERKRCVTYNTSEE